MAREIVVWCDVHLQRDDARVSGSGRSAMVDGVTGEPDLCDECWDALTGDLRAFLEASRASTPTRRRSARGEDPPPSKANQYACPICQMVTRSGRSGLNSHLRLKHDTTLPRIETDMGKTLDGKPLTADCPDPGCDLRFESRVAAGTHASWEHDDGRKRPRNPESAA